jgi:hypothetical protein|tara:strand:- start:5158 stop:5319 length:162 start_codon:yes stop_codon:yes gene_type:complete
LEKYFGKIFSADGWKHFWGKPEIKPLDEIDWDKICKYSMIYWGTVLIWSIWLL